MQHRLLVIIFLVSFFSMHAMELTTTNHSSGISITDDLFVTAICPRLDLDRPARNTLRCICKKYLTLVHSQDELNTNYIAAYNKNDQCQMARWRDLGGCFDYQEFAQAIKNKKYFLTKYLVRSWGDNIWKMFYCSNLKIAIATKTVNEIVPVVKWLLCAIKSDDINFCNSYNFAKKLVGQYPDVQKIIDLFEKYKDDELRRKLQERAIAQACSGLSIASCYGPVTDYY